MYIVNIIDHIIDKYSTNKPVYAASQSKDSDNKYRFFTDIDDAIATLSKPEYSQALTAYDNGFAIYRGDWNIKKSSDFGAEIVPGLRVSQNTSNVYTRLLSDLLPSWKAFPPRNRAAICTTSASNASDYGDSYVIFPENGTEIGICSDYDIWNSFDDNIQKYKICNMAEFNEAIIEFISIVDGISEDGVVDIFHSGSVSDLNDVFDILDRNIKTKDISVGSIRNINSKPFMKFLYDKILHGSDMRTVLDNLLSPKRNGFSIVNISSGAKIGKKYSYVLGREVWFSGKYVAVANWHINEILEQLN